ncbi:MAG: GxxExxY protein [Bacteroidetes bacterium]|nr:GxxExxY protein [Bacteroidota bacterium]
MKQIKTDSFLHANITSQIIEVYYKVYNTLGYGFLEKVYENAVKIELEKRGLKVEIQKSIEVYYEGKVVGYYVADMVVEGVVVIENKAAKCLNEEHENQLLNYLKATTIEVGLLLNFGLKPEFRRKIFENRFK